MDWSDVFTGRQREKLLTETVSKIAGLYKLGEELGDRKKDELKGFYGDEDKIDDMEVAGYYGDGDKLVYYRVALYQKMFFPSVPKPGPADKDKTYKPYLYEHVVPESLSRIIEKYRLTPKLIAEAIERLKEKLAKKKDASIEVARAAEELEMLATSTAAKDLLSEIELGRTAMFDGDSLELMSLNDGSYGGLFEYLVSGEVLNPEDYRRLAEKYHLRAEALAELRAKIER